MSIMRSAQRAGWNSNSYGSALTRRLRLICTGKRCSGKSVLKISEFGNRHFNKVLVAAPKLIPRLTVERVSPLREADWPCAAMSTLGPARDPLFDDPSTALWRCGRVHIL